MFKNKIINFTCFDAGVAEVISNFIKSKKIKNYNLILGNISKKIFEKNHVKINKIRLDQCLKKSDIFITGTSWKYDYELKLINKIKKLKKKKTIIILDDFINLKKRFLYKRKYIFPDEVWIPNNLPLQKINLKFFNKCKIKFIRNHYLLNLKKQMKNIKKNLNYKKNYLFLSQPIREVSNKFTHKKIKYDEYDYLKKLLIKLDKNILSKKINLISIRLHPAEKKNKYNNLIKKFKYLPIKLSRESLLHDIIQHYFIFGMNTNAMKIALLNSNLVISMLKKKKIKDFFLNQKVLNFNQFN